MSATQIALATTGVLAVFALIAIKIVSKSHHSPVRLWKDFWSGPHDEA